MILQARYGKRRGGKNPVNRKYGETIAVGAADTYIKCNSMI
jgi:hypothetical protein